MKKTIYLLIITVITVGCVIWGTMWNAGFGFGFHHYSEESGKFVENSNELEAFDSIIVDTDVVDIEIKEGAGFELAYNCTENLVPEYKVDNGVLHINQKKKKNYYFNTSGCNVIVTIPSGTSLKKIEIQSDVGDVTMNGICADYCKADLDVGDFTAKDSVLEEMILDGDTGDIKIKNSEFTSIDAESNVGEIEIDSSRNLDDYRYDVSTDVGEIKINGEEYEHQYKVNKGTGSVILSSDVGDIDIKY